jgi:hypothetical protein
MNSWLIQLLKNQPYTIDGATRLRQLLRGWRHRAPRPRSPSVRHPPPSSLARIPADVPADHLIFSSLKLKGTVQRDLNFVF